MPEQIPVPMLNLTRTESPYLKGHNIEMTLSMVNSNISVFTHKHDPESGWLFYNEAADKHHYLPVGTPEEAVIAHLREEMKKLLLKTVEDIQLAINELA